MSSDIQTTCMILAWSLLLSWLGAGIVLWQTFRRPLPRLAERPRCSKAPPLLPGLILGLLIVLVGQGAFHIPLIPAVHGELGWLARVGLGFAPAVVLLMASGMLASLAINIPHEYQQWASEPFTTVQRGFGLAALRGLGPLIVARSLVRCYVQGLPWLFSELVVVEALFNVPGLGWDAWQRARSRDMAGLLGDLLLLAALYALALLASACLQRWLARRLESYG